MSTYPHSTCNQNVPKGAFLLTENSYTSGEYIETYYIIGDGYIFKVGDWVGMKPQPVMQFEACRETGDTVQMIEARYRNFVEEQKEREA